jgi:hypothetical protein
MRPPALNDLSIAMSVIGLREHYENLSAQKRRVSFFHGRTTTRSVKSVATIFFITARERCWGITFVGGELFQRSRSMLQLDAQNSGLFLASENILPMMSAPTTCAPIESEAFDKMLDSRVERN